VSGWIREQYGEGVMGRIQPLTFDQVREGGWLDPGTEDVFADVVALAEAGRMTRRGMPCNLLDLAVLARTYDREAHTPFLTVGVQRLLLAPLVFAAGMRDYQRKTIFPFARTPACSAIATSQKSP
jgi:hypothetical protein